MDDQYLLPGLENFSLSDIEQISSLNVHSSSMRYPLDNLLPAQNFAGLFIHQPDYNSTLSTDNDNSDRKRKAMEFGIPGRNSTPADFSPQVSGNGISRKNGTEAAGRGKKVKRSEKKEMNPMEVVHVRARRGQATDSHSIAERVRREKINERLRCLQDIVPGCYKTMGMAVMLDEIINYVQSLQNQVEFLSMKLTAASTFHDFNSETDTLERAKPIEAIKMNQNEVSGCVDFGPLGLNFQYAPQFPYNR